MNLLTLDPRLRGDDRGRIMAIEIVENPQYRKGVVAKGRLLAH